MYGLTSFFVFFFTFFHWTTRCSLAHVSCKQGYWTPESTIQFEDKAMDQRCEAYFSGKTQDDVSFKSFTTQGVIQITSPCKSFLLLLIQGWATSGFFGWIILYFLQQ